MARIGFGTLLIIAGIVIGGLTGLQVSTFSGDSSTTAVLKGIGIIGGIPILIGLVLVLWGHLSRRSAAKQ